jgi:hypothetical protein
MFQCTEEAAIGSVAHFHDLANAWVRESTQHNRLLAQSVGHAPGKVARAINHT